MGLAESATNNQNLDEAIKAKIDKLRATHELWKVYAPDWDLYLSAYEGGSDFAAEKNLFKHARENLEDFKDRVARLHYLNYCEPLVDFFTNFIFAETIDRHGGTNKDWYDTFIKDVNMKGDSIDDYMRMVSDDMQIFGMSFTLVDTPALPAGINESDVTKQDEADLNIRPYWLILRPDEIIDWVVDDFDNFEYVKRRQIINKIENGEILIVEKYTEWFKDKIVINFVDITDPAKPKLLTPQNYPNTLGEIPLYVARYKRSKRNPHMGNSFLRDFAYNNREIMNLTSLLQEFLYRQAFNILAVEIESGLPMKDQEEGVIGNSNRMEVPKGANFPEYLSPPAEPASFIQGERERIKQEMFRRAAQDTLNELFNGEKSSGFSQAQSFSKTVPFIASRADTLEKAENALMTFTMKLIGKQWDGKVKYKDRYELTNLTDALTQLMMLGRDLQLPSPTFFIEEMKRLVHEFDGKIPTEILAKVEKEIEGLDFNDWQETQKAALIGQPKPDGGTSPGAQHKSKSSGTMAEAASEAKSSNVGATKKVR